MLEKSFTIGRIMYLGFLLLITLIRQFNPRILIQRQRNHKQ